MRPVYRQYMKSFIPAMSAYVVVLIVSILLLQKLGPSAPIYVRIALALSPVIPIVFACLAIMRFVRDSDELERKIELEAIALSSLFTGLIFMCLGFLASSKLIYLNGAMVAIWVFPSLCGLYGISKCISSRRYR